MQRQPASLPLNPPFALEQPPTDPLLLDTPLHRAVRQGSEETVKQLLNAGEDPLAGADSSKGTPLFQAARLGHKEIVKLLSENPLHLEQAILDAISLCEHKKTHPNLPDEASKTIHLLLQYKKQEVPFQHGGLMYLALKKNNKALAYRLQFYGAQIAFAICEAASRNDVDFLTKLIQGDEEKANSRNAKQTSALYLAAKEGHEQAIQQLIDLKADLNAALHDAATLGDEQAIERLLKKNAEVNSCNQLWETALYLAAEKGHSKAIEQLAKNRANIDFPRLQKFTPLHAAAESGRANIVKQLLDLKAEINSLTEFDNTPLCLAAEHGHESVVELLIHAAREQKKELKPGTSPFLVTQLYPLKAAISNNRPSIVKMLLDEIPKEALDLNAILDDTRNSPSLHIAAVQGYASIVELLLNAQADIHQRNVESATPLTLAIINGHTETVEVLLRHKATVHRKNEDDYSLLPIAAREGYLKIVQALLREKLPEEEEKKEMKSVAEMAAKKREDKTRELFYEDYKNALLSAIIRSHPLVLRELLDAPLRPDLKQSACKDLLKLAIQHANADIIAELLRVELKEHDASHANEMYRNVLKATMECGRPLPVITTLFDHPLSQQMLRNDQYDLLICAAARGYSTIVKKLLPTEWKENDLYVKQVYHTAFLLAKQYNYSPLIMELVSHPLSQDLSLEEQLFALQDGVTNGYIAMKLLPTAFEINNPHTQQCYQQMIEKAIQSGHALMLELLLQCKTMWTALSKELCLKIITFARKQDHADIIKQVLEYTIINQFLTASDWYKVLFFAIVKNRLDIVGILLTAIELTIQSFQSRAKLCQHPLLADKAPALSALLTSTDRLLQMADKQNLIHAIDTLKNKIDQLPPHFVDLTDDVNKFILEVDSQWTSPPISWLPPRIDLNGIVERLLMEMRKIALFEAGKAAIDMRRRYTKLLAAAIGFGHPLALEMLLKHSLGHGIMTPAYFKQQLLLTAEDFDIATAQKLIQHGQSLGFQAALPKALPHLLTEILLVILENRDKDKEDWENNPDKENIVDKKAKFIDLLLDHNADPCAINPQGEDALLLAVDDFQGHEKTVQALLSLKAKPTNTFGPTGRNALFVAVDANQPEIVKLLLTSRASSNLTKKNDRSVLAMAVEKRYTKIVSQLLDTDANPNITDEKGEDILVVATTNGDTEIVSLLLKAQANPNITEQNGRNALAVAIKKGHKEIVHQLLNAKANPNLKDEKGLSGLVVATVKGNIEIMRLLLTFKANPQVRDENISYPLTLAAKANNLQAVKLLIDFKADTNAEKGSGKGALFVATRYNDMAIANLLIAENNKRLTKTRRPFSQAPESVGMQVAENSQVPAQETIPSHLKVVKMLLEADQANTQLAENQKEKGITPPSHEGMVVEMPLTEPGTQLRVTGEQLMKKMIEENRQLKLQLLNTQTQLSEALKREKRLIKNTLAHEKPLSPTKARHEKRKSSEPPNKSDAPTAKKRK